MNRGKVVGPVPWPLWPYVRGTGRAGMGHTPPLNLGVVGESMWSPASRSQATLYRNLTRLEHAGPPGPRGRQGQRTRARRAGARQGPRDGQTERGKAQSRARPQDFFKMFSAGGVVGGRHPACSTENPRTTTPSRLPRRTRLYQKTARRRLRTFTPTDSRTGIRPPCPLGYARPPVPPTRWHMHACVCVTCLYVVCHTRTRPYALPPRIANPCRACHRSMTRNVPSPRSSRSRSSRQTKAPARFAEPSNP